MTKTVVELVMNDERGKYLEKYLNNPEMIRRLKDWDSDSGLYEINIECGFDLLKIFHAGIHYGMDVMKK